MYISQIDADFYQAMGGLALVLGFVGTMLLWGLKQIIRNELSLFRKSFIEEVIEPIRRDVHDLRHAGLE